HQFCHIFGLHVNSSYRMTDQSLFWKNWFMVLEHKMSLSCRMPRQTLFLPKNKGGIGLLHITSQLRAFWAHCWWRALTALTADPTCSWALLLTSATDIHYAGSSIHSFA